jgi:hypothetical protein
MKNSILAIISVVVFVLSFGLYATSQAEIETALDLGAGIKIIELGQYKGNNPKDWKIANKGSFPGDRSKHIENPSGIDAALVGSSCLKLPMPSTKVGYESMINLRSRNYFVIQVQGDGELTFNYRTSMDGQQDEKFIIYMYNGSNAAQLKADDTDTPAEDAPTITTSYYNELFSDTGTWQKVETFDGEKYYSEDGDTWWNDGSVELSSSENDAYTRNIVFAVVGKADKDSWGDKFELDNEQISLEYIENAVYIDNLQWTPDETQPQKVSFEPEPVEGGFQKSQMILLNSDYDASVFDFYYTTDGTTPTKKSKKYTTTGSADDGTLKSPIVLSENTTLKVAVFEKATKYNGNTAGNSAVEVVSKTYTFAIPTPTVSMADGAAFSDTTIFTITGDYYDEITYVYTLDGTTPTANSTAITTANNTAVLTLQNTSLDGETLKIAALCDEKVSAPLTLNLSRVATPTVVFQLDGTVASATDNIFDAQVTWSAPAGCVITPDSITSLTSDGTVRYYAPGTDTALSSLITERNFVNANQELPVNKEDILGSTSTADGWYLYTVPKQISAASGKTLAAWLNAYEYDSANKCYRQAECIANGASYWVYATTIDWSAAPTIKCTTSTPESTTPAPAYKWEKGRFAPLSE